MVAKLLSITFEKWWLSVEVPSDSTKGNITPVFKKGRPGEPQAGESHDCSWEDYETVPPEGDVNAQARCERDLKQLAWFHHRHIVPDQSVGLL